MTSKAFSIRNPRWNYSENNFPSFELSEILSQIAKRLFPMALSTSFMLVLQRIFLGKLFKRFQSF